VNPLAAFKVAIAALRLSALRSFLAMLGVIIGVASVIVMVSVASGAGQAIEDRIKALGTNLLVIQPGSYTSGGRRAGDRRVRRPDTSARQHDDAHHDADDAHDLRPSGSTLALPSSPGNAGASLESSAFCNVACVARVTLTPGRIRP